MPWHAAGDRVDRVDDGYAVVLEEGQLTGLMLGLSRGETVARDDDDLLRVRKLDRHVFAVMT